jgi:hypothetical protein
LKGERRWHLAVAAFVGGIALAASAAAHHPTLAIVTIAIAAAGGIAFINSTGNLAGFVGPSIVGLIKDLTHSFAGGLLAMSFAVLLAGFIALALPDIDRPPHAGSFTRKTVEQ